MTLEVSETETIDADAPVGEKKPQIKSADELDAEAKQVLYDEISAWKKVTDKLAPLIAEEKKLREELAKKYFTDPREGTNKITLGFGKELKLKHGIKRELDEAALDAASVQRLIDPDLVSKVINYKPAVSVTGWKSFTDEQRALFKDIITEKPSFPSLELFTPKR